MYYPGRSFDSDWLVLLLGVAALAAVIMYNPAPPHTVAEGLSHVLVVDAVRGDSNTTILLYSPTDIHIILPDQNISTALGRGMHKISTTAGGSIGICAEGTDFNECGVVYPVTP